MKRITPIILMAILLFAACSPKQTEPDTNFTQYVNPLVGTDFHGHTYPGALVPFGMIQPSPDTRLDGWDGCSGYHYSDDLVYGFTHTHLSGTGCLDYGDVLLMPFMKEASVINTEYASKFSHANEIAEPGYYAVTLDKNNVKVEMTASQRVALHRYTFPNTPDKKGIIVDLKHRDVVLESSMSYDTETQSLSGIRNSNSWNSNQQLAFSILFSHPIEKIDYYIDDQIVDNTTSIEGRNCKAAIYFADNTEDIVLKVAISANTQEPLAAMKNHTEVADFDFDKVRKEADESWNKELGKIVVESNDIEKKKVFYTALYHSFTAPYLFTDADGSYYGQDGKIHKTDGHNMYTVFSLWDTYRALHPLITLIDRKRTEDFLYTFMRHHEQGGQLPVWELAGFETWCMIGYHSVPVVLDAYRKGIVSYDPNEMLAAMVHSAKLNKLGRPEYAQYGYIPADMEHEDVSKTLEYAYDDWVIAQFAKEIGNEAVYNEFIERCQFYKNILDPNGFMHSKMNGGFEMPFNPAEVNNRFTEGNSWQYSTYVPHDLATYIQLIGGRDIAERHFDSLFHTSMQLAGRDQVDVTGLIGQYAHGNEPSHHAAYLYNYIAKPWKTQELVRQIMRELYTSKPDGLCGNEDCGQMSAWYVLSSMGFYPVCPGDNQYVIGSPVFDKVTINLENGKQFVITCKDQNDKNVYIKSAKLNGKELNRSYLTFDDIKDGGQLDFVMSAQPNTKLWIDDTAIPHSEVTDNQITIVPTISTFNKTFKGEMDVEISLYEPAVKGNATISYPTQTDKIYYTLDGSEPTKESIPYSGPIKITENTVLKAVAWNEKTGYSKVTESHYARYEKDKNIEILSEYLPMYAAGGDEALIDNVRGKANFSLGGWQGYWGNDFEAIVDLGTVKSISEIGAGFLQATRSWIFFPTEVTFEISEDKQNFKPYGKVLNPHTDRDETQVIDDFIVKKPAKARYVRVKAKNYGKLPDWHLGHGGDSYIFIDEIFVK
ncbi:GH92 family glycosyl hydrolase [Bacteroidales bacterium OttesenSCG-928-C03]|nr:GH92 family glycosyl hydrolase [Bacteroidales bacterium OttesenSCG-928-C03]